MEARARWLERAGELALTLPGVLIFLALSRTSRDQVSDDAWICFRYAWNLLHGAGLDWNAQGPAVEGYSNLLWLLLMVPGALLGAPVASWAQGVGLTLMAGAVGMSAALTRAAGGGRAAAVATGALCGASPVLLGWGMAGLEPPLLAFLVTAGALGLARAGRDGRPGLWLLAFALLPVAHASGPALLGAPLFWLALHARRLGPRVTLLALLALAAPALLQLALRLALYGEILPNTWVVKVDARSGPGLAWRGLRYALGFFTWDRALGLALALGGLGALIGRAGLLLLPMLGMVAFSVAVGGDQLQGLRFLVGPAPAMIAAAMIGFDIMLRRAPRLPGWGRELALGALGLALLSRALGAGELISVTTPRPPPRGVGGWLSLLTEEHARALPQEGGWSRLWGVERRARETSEPAWFVSALVEGVPEGRPAVFGDVGLLGYALNGVDVLDYRGLNWRAMAELLAHPPPEGPEGLRTPEARAVLDEVVARAPAMMLMQCGPDGLFGPFEALMLGTGLLPERYELAGHGRYFTAHTYICLFRLRGLEPVAPETVIARYERISREMGDVLDVDERLEAWREGRAPPLTPTGQKTMRYLPGDWLGTYSYAVVNGGRR